MWRKIARMYYLEGQWRGVLIRLNAWLLLKGREWTRVQLEMVAGCRRYDLYSTLAHARYTTYYMFTMPRAANVLRVLVLIGRSIPCLPNSITFYVLLFELKNQSICRAWNSVCVIDSSVDICKQKGWVFLAWVFWELVPSHCLSTVRNTMLTIAPLTDSHSNNHKMPNCRVNVWSSLKIPWAYSYYTLALFWGTSSSRFHSYQILPCCLSGCPQCPYLRGGNVPY